MSGKAKPLYKDVADRIAAQIANGTIRVGGRIPSIRSTSRKLSVSITTVIEAYRVLEDRGSRFHNPASLCTTRRSRGDMPNLLRLNRRHATCR